MQLIEDLLQSRRALADDIQQLLEYRHSDFDSDVMGLETEFARESCYAERKQISTGRLDSMWINFVTSLKTESRFINNAVSSTLDGIFQGVETMRARGKEPVIMTLDQVQLSRHCTVPGGAGIIMSWSKYL
ncbi:hypothetical protein ACLXAZ_30130 [Escherichia coli]